MLNGKSSRVILASPPLDVPNGGLAKITSAFAKFSPTGPKELPSLIAPCSPPISCSKQFICARRRVFGTSSTPVNAFSV